MEYGQVAPILPISVCPVLKGHHFGHFFKYADRTALVVATVNQLQVQPCKEDPDAVDD